jgi:hypothetical protein
MITQLDHFRNAAMPLNGNKTSSFNYAGSCLTSQSVIFHSEALETLNIKKAIWRICWKPNITNGSQTAIRLISANSGPSNINQIVATFSGGKTNTPLNEAFDITESLKALIESNSPSVDFPNGSMFQLITQSAGDGSNGCLIYSSSIELIYDI